VGPILTDPKPTRGGGNKRERRAGVETREWKKKGEEEEGTRRERKGDGPHNANSWIRPCIPSWLVVSL